MPSRFTVTGLRSKGEALLTLAFFTLAACSGAAARNAPTVAMDVGAQGQLQSAIELAVPPYHGLEPKLRLTYDSNGGNGITGVGWNLTGLSTIQRSSPSLGSPRYDASDVFYIDGAELIPCAPGTPSPSCRYPASSAYTAYTGKIERYQRIALVPGTTGGSWYIWDKTGTKATYEPAVYKSLAGPFGWKLASVEDTLGNRVKFSRWQDVSAQDLGDTYFDSIAYNGVVVKFLYEVRPDPITYAVGGALVTQRYRLKGIDVSVGGTRARVYALSYQTHSSTGRSVLTGVRQYGTDATLDAAGNVINGSSRPPTALTYQSSPSASRWEPILEPVNGVPPSWDGVSRARTFPAFPQLVNSPYSWTFHGGDFDGDGRTDALLRTVVGISQGSNGFPAGVPILNLTTQFADGKKVQWTMPVPDRQGNMFSFLLQPFDGRTALLRSWVADVNADGLSDLILMSWIPSDPSTTTGHLRLLLTSVLSEGNGQFRASSVAFSQTPWVTSVIDGGSGQFSSLGPSCQPGDVNGDGRADFLCLYTEHDGRQFLGVALSVGDGTFDLSRPPLLIADDPGSVPDDWNTSFTNILPFETRSMSIGDVDGDGLDDVQILDLRPSDTQACDINSLASCTIHFDLLTAHSVGDGTFTMERTETNWTREITDVGDAVFAADLNGDGRSDYLLIQRNLRDRGNVTIRSIKTAIRTASSAAYAFAEQSPSGSLATTEVHVTLGDANGDGMTDLMVVAPVAAGGGVSCLSAPGIRRPVLSRVLSRGDGTFALPTRWDDCRFSQEVSEPWSDRRIAGDVQAADTNGDGLADFLLAFTTLNNSVAQFRVYDDPSPLTARDTRQWIPLDVTGDGRDDFVYIASQTITSYVHTLVRQPNGSYRSERTPIPGWPSLRSWKPMDVNGDGRIDLVHLGCTYASVAAPCTLTIDTMLSDGNGRFTRIPAVQFTWPQSRGDVATWRPIDANGDGRVDLVHIQYTTSNPPTIDVKVLLSTGSGTWSELPLQTISGLPAHTLDPLAARRLQATANWRSMDVNGDGSGDLVYIDYAGGLEEISTLSSNRDGTFRIESSFAALHAGDGWLGAGGKDAINWRVADVNGDGKADLVHLMGTSSGLRAHSVLSTGNPGVWLTRWSDIAPSSGSSLINLADTLGWMVTDTDSDGRADLVKITSNSTTSLTALTLRSVGVGTWDLKVDLLTDVGQSGGRLSPSWTALELNGDGLLDAARVDATPSGSALEVSSLRSTAARDVLVSHSFMGGTRSVQYGSSSDSLVVDMARKCSLPSGMTALVVTVMSADDGRSGSFSKTYSYDCARWSPSQRSFLGWAEIDVAYSGGVNRPSSTYAMQYLQTDECATQLQGTFWRDAAGTLIAGRDIYAYNPPEGPPYNCTVLYHQHIEYGSGSTPAMNALTYFSYDEFGNVRQVLEHGVPNTLGDERTTTISYKPATGPFIVGAPRQLTISEGLPPQMTLLMTSYFCYDGDNGTDFSNCSGLPTQGLLTAMQRVDDRGFYIRSFFFYDSFGNVAGIRDANHHGQTTFYDPVHHLYPVFACDALDRCIQQEWDPVIGRRKKATDENNHETRFVYDRLGRLSLVQAPDGGMVRYEYLDWGDAHRQRVRQKQDDGSADGLWIDSYFDGLGRLYKMVRKGPKLGVRYARDYAYADDADQLHLQSDWYEIGGPQPLQEIIAYDGARRVISQTHPDKTLLRWSYETTADSAGVVTYDERDRRKSASLDAHGRLIRIGETHEGTELSTSFVYNAADELVRTTDAQGNVTTQMWNMLGERTQVSDPNLGTWSYKYDLVGNVLERTDGNNVTITFAFDQLNRLKTKTYPSGDQIVFSYDEAGHGAGVGRLTSVTEPGAPFSAGCSTPTQARTSHEYEYDAVGRILTETRCVDGRTMAMTFRYDTLGRTSSVVYPDGEVVRYNYDEAGRLYEIPGLVRFDYNASNAVTRASYANRTVLDLIYHPTRRWLSDMTLSSGPQVRFQAGYRYEPNGVPKSSSSTTHLMNLTFGYDDLDRLTTVTGDAAQSLTYDWIGNILTNSDVGVYDYPDSGSTGCLNDSRPIPCEGPHRVEKAGTHSFRYDKNGNMLVDSDAAIQRERRFAWNYDNQPEWMWDYNGMATRTLFGAFGDRVLRWRGSEYTRYYGRFVEEPATGSLVKNYFAGNTLVARRDGTGLHWFHQDRLGSTRLITSDKGLEVARYDYRPFGEKIQWSGHPNSTQFTGQSADDANGVVYLNARYYDPKISRFISADTLVPDPTLVQAFNRYAYAYNAPMTYVDPTGHEPIDVHYGYLGPGSSGTAGRFGGLSANTFRPPCSACRPGPAVTPRPSGGTASDLGARIEKTEFYKRVSAPLDYPIDPFATVPGPPLIPQLLQSTITGFVDLLKLGSGAAEASHLEGADAIVPILQDVTRFSFGFNLLASPTLGIKNVGGREIAGGPRLIKRSPFNEIEGKSNCVQCVTSLIDAVANEGLVMSAHEYPAIATGSTGRALEYITGQTGVKFGRVQELFPGEVPIGQGDFVIFTRFKDGKPGHVIFGRNLGTETWFYDPQAGTGVLLNEKTVNYPIIYP